MRNNLMKSISVFMALVFLTSQTLSLSAKSSNVFLASLDESVLILDESALDEAMLELNELDEFLNANAGVTFTDLQSVESELIVGVENSTAPLGMDNEGEPPLGIPSFLWGCLLGLVGILLVYILTDGDKDETKKALWGMLVWVGVVIVVYVAAYSTVGFWY